MESTETLQVYILEGRKIILKKENKAQKIQIRFNQHDVDGKTKWRVIVDGVEYLTSDVDIRTNSRTESEFFADFGEYKHHIVAFANEVQFIKNIAYII